ncbi:hypothetical protein SAMN05421788_10376 [Filimonas lacunae]|uniref:Dolichyl-phosphate-mannose-protein mannosyltransferase n=1 Tax=Filimonas lacunae TaxID=477680 RepID=A0A1N7P0J3_9BACT|nr:hypothetical protein [Filimonas lacunae]SIT04087.1 hypothetical protein SAMN05421788_10376 [Filimonas lacunae]
MKSDSLLKSIFTNKTYRNYLWITLIGSIIQLTLFKHFYPFPDFISDSYNYIETAQKGLTVNLWPIGYARFLAFMHWIFPSHQLLVVAQHFILVAGLLYFFYTVCYLFTLPKAAIVLLYIFLFFNPIFLYLSNCVLSDAIFTAISIVLFAQYLWMLRQAKNRHLIIQAVLIGVAFTIRYTAIYYPIVSIAAILFARLKWTNRLAGIIAPWLLILPFIVYTQQETKKQTGVAEFSVFGGWQIACNALYMYQHITVDSNMLPPETRLLDKYTQYYFKHIHEKNPPFEAIQGTYFIKVPNAILKPYLFDNGLRQPNGSGFQFWGSVSPVYKTYGNWLIRHYPLAFVQYYIWLNTRNYFIPYPEKFEIYNIGSTEVWDGAREWFRLPSNKISLIPSIHFQGYLFYIAPWCFFLLNIYFLTQFAFFLFSKPFKNNHRFLNISILLATFFLLVNFAFSVFATPVVLRYQVIPMIIMVAFAMLLTHYSNNQIERSPQ